VRGTAVLLLLLLAAACSKKEDPQANLNAQNRVAMRAVRLYYESPSMLLASETRNIPLPENPGAAVPVVVRELMKGPATAAGTRLFPVDTVVRGTYLLPEGTVVVDLGGATLTQGWGTGSHQELMTIYSLVWTVTSNFGEAKRVRLLVNGSPSETLAGHVSLSRSLTPKPDLLDPRAP
jgi:Sporulation and spore germination